MSMRRGHHSGHKGSKCSKGGVERPGEAEDCRCHWGLHAPVMKLLVTALLRCTLKEGPSCCPCSIMGKERGREALCILQNL